MEMKDPNQTAGSIEDIFNEALELDNEALEDLATEVAWTPFTDEIESDPTFYDEQVINVPVIENPGLKKVTEYPDTQIYDHLFSLDEEDDFLIPEEPPVPVIEEISAPSVPEDTPAATILKAHPAASDQRKPGRKPAVRKAGEKKPEPKAPAVKEAVVKPAIVEEAKPIRKKPRVKRADEKATGTKHAPGKAAPIKAAVKTTSKNVPSRPVYEKRKTVAKASAPAEEFDETVDLITWEEGSSVKVAQKKAAAKKAEKKAETRAFFDKFKKKLAKKLP